MTNTGTYLEVDGRPAVRFERTYAHPIDTVWSLVSDPAELPHWFPMKADFELRTGAPVRFYGDPNMAGEMPGRILDVDPPRLLAIEWGADELRFELQPMGAERTRFTLTNFLATPDTAARTAGGWEVCLHAMDLHLGAEPTSAGNWQQHYRDYIAAGVPYGAPIPGDPDFG